MPNNAPHNALRRAVNRAIASGAPVYVNQPAESRPYTFDELTAAEQCEVNFRGFPRGADIRYITRPKAAEKDWQLVRWTRVQVQP